MGDVIDIHAAALFKPNTRRSKGRPSKASSKMSKYLGGILPLTFQLLAVEPCLEPTKAAAAADPPTASTTSSTVRSIMIRSDTSRCVMASRPHVMQMDSDRSAEFHVDVDGAYRKAIIGRLQLLPALLGKTHTEIAEDAGVSQTQWANYRAAGRKDVISPEAAINLWRAYGIPITWIYTGEMVGGFSPEMQERVHRLVRAQGSQRHSRAR